MIYGTPEKVRSPHRGEVLRSASQGSGQSRIRQPIGCWNTTVVRGSAYLQRREQRPNSYHPEGSPKARLEQQRHAFKSASGVVGKRLYPDDSRPIPAKACRLVWHNLETFGLHAGNGCETCRFCERCLYILAIKKVTDRFSVIRNPFLYRFSVIRAPPYNRFSVQYGPKNAILYNRFSVTLYIPPSITVKKGNKT